MHELPERSTIDRKYRWNEESVFATRDDWRREFNAVAEAIPRLQSFAGRLSEGADTLSSFFAFRDDIGSRVETLHFYAFMSATVDTGDEEAQSINGQSGSLIGKYRAAVAFAEPELLAIGRETLDRWVAVTPALAEFAHWVDDLFRLQEHVRSAEVEELLGSAEEVFESIGTIHDMQVDSDLKFAPARDSAGKEWPVAQSTVESYLATGDRELRKNAWHSFSDSHLANGPSLAATLVTSVKKDSFIARARDYGSTLDAALFSDNIPRKVYDATLETFEKNRAVWHRYWRARRKALGVDRLAHWDIWAPLTAKTQAIPYEKAVGWIESALAPLGGEYTAALRRGCLEDRWVDVYPSKGKGSGAFSGGTRLTSPFIMMSYADDFSSLSTLTHELGHSMHSLHANRAQKPVNSEYSIFVAEVASNFHQAMTRAWLFDHEKDRDFQLGLIGEAMENFHRYFFIMPTLALFERELHRRIEDGKGVTAGDLNALTADLFEAGYGGEMEIDRDREGSTWAQFSHLYANFYVFQYATGISAAHALAAPILAGNDDAAKRYIEFISSGGSRYPVDALKKAGVDMSTPAAMEKGFEVLSGLVDRLERLTAAT